MIKNKKYDSLPNDLMLPMDAIMKELPNVWLNSFYDFKPEKWGGLGFTVEGNRRNFINQSQAGVLVVIYITKNGVHEAERGKIVGILQCSHQECTLEECIAPDEWRKKQDNKDERNRWNYAVKVVKAWKITDFFQEDIVNFADKTYNSKHGMVITSQGKPLTKKEANKILDLEIQEVPVYGEMPIVVSAPVIARQIFSNFKGI